MAQNGLLDTTFRDRQLWEIDEDDLPLSLQGQVPGWCTPGIKNQAYMMNRAQVRGAQGNLYSIADYCTRAHLLMQRSAIGKNAMKLAFAGMAWIFSGATGEMPAALLSIFAVLGLLTVMIMVKVEFECLQWVILPWQQRVNRLDFLWFDIRSVRTWWMCHCMVSCISHVSHLAHAAILGASFKDPLIYVPMHWIFGETTVNIPIPVAVWVLGFGQLTHALFRHTPAPCFEARNNDPWRFEIDRCAPGTAAHLRPDHEIRFRTTSSMVNPRWQSTHLEALIDWSRAANCAAVSRVIPSYFLGLAEQQPNLNDPDGNLPDEKQRQRMCKLCMRLITCQFLIVGLFIDGSAIGYQTYLLNSYDKHAGMLFPLSIMLLILQSLLRQAPLAWSAISLSWKNIRVAGGNTCNTSGFMFAWLILLLLVAIIKLFIYFKAVTAILALLFS